MTCNIMGMALQSQFNQGIEVRGPHFIGPSAPMHDMQCLQLNTSVSDVSNLKKTTNQTGFARARFDYKGCFFVLNRSSNHDLPRQEPQ